jgi:hypothetical protein
MVNKAVILSDMSAPDSPVMSRDTHPGPGPLHHNHLSHNLSMQYNRTASKTRFGRNLAPREFVQYSFPRKNKALLKLPLSITRKPSENHPDPQMRREFAIPVILKRYSGLK